MTPVKLVRMRGAMLISLSMSTCGGTRGVGGRVKDARRFGTACQSKTSAQGLPSDLQIGREGVGEPHVAWEGTEDEVAELDAVGRDHVAEAVMVVAQELWEVVQQDQEHSQCTLWKGGGATEDWVKGKACPNC